MNRKITWRPVGELVNNLSELRGEVFIGLALLAIGGWLSGGANYLAWDDALVALNRPSVFLATLLAAGLLIYLVVAHWKYYRAKRQGKSVAGWAIKIALAGVFTFWGVGTIVEGVNIDRATSSPTYTADGKRLTAIDRELESIRMRLDSNAESRAKDNPKWRTGQNTINRTTANDEQLMARQNRLEAERAGLRERMRPVESGHTLAISGTVGKALSFLPTGFVLFLLSLLVTVIIEGFVGVGARFTAPAVLKESDDGTVDRYWEHDANRQGTPGNGRGNGQWWESKLERILDNWTAKNGQHRNALEPLSSVHSGQPRVSENGQPQLLDSGKNGQGRGGGNGQRRRRKSGQSKEMRQRVLDGYIEEYPDASLNQMCDAAGVSSRETVRKDLHEMGYSWNSDRGRWMSKRAAVA